MLGLLGYLFSANREKGRGAPQPYLATFLHLSPLASLFSPLLSFPSCWQLL
jgi:hypothetical protein